MIKREGNVVMKVLVVGTGSIGRRHIEVLQSIGRHDVGICELDKNNADEAAQKYAIDEVYYDLDDALKSGFDVVIVCTPNAYHADASVAAMEAGCDVLVEKPIASSIADAWQIVTVSERTGRTVMVGYTLRVYPGLREIKDLIDSGRLGKPVSVRVNLNAAVTLVLNKSDYRKSYETGGGIIYDYSHEIDYLRYLFGEIIRYACFVDSQVKKELSCDDVAEIILQYESDTIASIHMDYVLDGGRTLDIVCEKGRMHYDFNGSLCIKPEKGDSQSIRYNVDRNEMFAKQFELFEKACRGEKVAYVTAQDGLKVLQICEDLYEANEKNIVGF